MKRRGHYSIKLTANSCIALCSFTKRGQYFIGTNDETLAVAMRVYEVRPRKDKRGVDLISDVLPFGQLWYDTPVNAVGYAQHYSRSHHAVIETHQHEGRLQRTVTNFPVVSVPLDLYGITQGSGGP